MKTIQFSELKKLYPNFKGLGPPEQPCTLGKEHVFETFVVRFDNPIFGAVQAPMRCCECGAATSNGIPNFADYCRTTGAPK